MSYRKISIITPSYNQGEFLEETLQSIIKQEYPNLELIVIDGGSTDNSLEIIKKYEQHITSWVSEKDRGQSHAINKGFAKATGDIINWINSDDILMPKALFEVNRYFNELPDNIGLIHGGTTIFTDSKIICNDFGYDIVNQERYFAGIAFPQPSAFFKRELLKKTGLLDESFHFQMDYDLYSRMNLLTDFMKVNYLFSRYRIHAESKTVAQAEKFVEDSIRIISRRANDINSLELIDTLKNLDLYKYDSSYTSLIATDISRPKEINIQKVLFYFTAYVLKFDYSAGRFKRARKLLQFLNKNFDHAEIENEKDLSLIIKRLSMFPDFMINFMRNIRNK